MILCEHKPLSACFGFMISQKWLVSGKINLRKRLNLIDVGAEDGRMRRRNFRICFALFEPRRFTPLRALAWCAAFYALYVEAVRAGRRKDESSWMFEVATSVVRTSHHSHHEKTLHHSQHGDLPFFRDLAWCAACCSLNVEHHARDLKGVNRLNSNNLRRMLLSEHQSVTCGTSPHVTL